MSATSNSSASGPIDPDPFRPTKPGRIPPRRGIVPQKPIVRPPEIVGSHAEGPQSSDLRARDASPSPVSPQTSGASGHVPPPRGSPPFVLEPEPFDDSYRLHFYLQVPGRGQVKVSGRLPARHALLLIKLRDAYVADKREKGQEVADDRLGWRKPSQLVWPLREGPEEFINGQTIIRYKYQIGRWIGDEAKSHGADVPLPEFIEKKGRAYRITSDRLTVKD